MELLIDALLEWIADHSDYTTSNIAHPAVIEMTPEALTREYYTGVPHLMPDDGVDERLNALYAATDGAHGTIYLMSAHLYEDAQHFEDPTENPLWREVLLHELVHHVQWQTGEADHWLCPAQGERQAYHLGGLFLQEAHATDPMENRTFWAHMYSRC